MKPWRFTYPSKNNRALTLVEILVVLTIFSVLAVGIAGSFISGMKIWGWARNTDVSQYHTFLTLEMIARELRSSLNLAEVGYVGDNHRVSFPALLGNSILKVTYKFDPQGKKLLRQQMDFKDVLDEKLQGNYTEKQVLDLEDFSLEYFFYNWQEDKYLWKDEWKKEEGVFLAIKIYAKTKTAEFNKRVFIPVS